MDMLIVLTENTSGMSDDLKGAIITAAITGVISIIGFIITYFSMKKNFKNELAMQRDNTALERMASVPYDTLDFYDVTIKYGKIDKKLEECNKNSNPTKQQLIDKKKLEEEKQKAEENLNDRMNFLYNTIYAYGSVTAIKIVAKMQSTNYVLGANATEEERLKVLAYMILLASQVKKDVTNITINPRYWLQMRITDYHLKHEKLDNAINDAVEELELTKDFKIR